MSPSNPRDVDQYTLTFSSNKLLLGICGLLLLMMLSVMLGIRIERYQQQQGLMLEARARLEPLAQQARLSAATAAAAEPATVKITPGPRAIQAADLSDEIPPPTPILLTKASAPRLAPKRTVAVPAPKRAAKPATSKPGNFVVQVVSSRDKTLANQRVRLLTGQGVPAFVESANLGAKGMWYRVLAGTYASKTEAKAMLAKLQADPQFEASFVRTY